MTLLLVAASPGCGPEATAAAAPEPARTIAAGAPERPPDPGTALSLAFVGDVVFGRYRAGAYDPIAPIEADPLGEVAPLLVGDLVVANLETPITTRLPDSSPIGTRYRFGATIDQARALARAGISGVSLANNHAMDLGPREALATADHLRALGIEPFGSPTTEPEAVRVETVEVAGWRVGVLAVTTRRNLPQADEGPWLPFVVETELRDVLGPRIQAARAGHHLLAVLVHWGEEYAEVPAEPQIRQARALIDAGVDLVIGHHPHVLQGIEARGRGVIAYSLGNFLFENLKPVPRLSGVLRVSLSWASGRACLERVAFAPVVLRREPWPHPVPARGAVGRRVTGRLARLSAAVGASWRPGLAAEVDAIELELPACSPPMP